MNYATKAKKKSPLSENAQRAFQMIALTIIEKAEREQKIPQTIRLTIITDDAKVDAELRRNGIISYQFTDQTTGAKVYDHIVDTEALAEILPHLKRH